MIPTRSPHCSATVSHALLWCASKETLMDHLSATLRTWERPRGALYNGSTTAIDFRIVRTLLRRDGRFPSMLRETATNRNWIVC